MSTNIDHPINFSKLVIVMIQTCGSSPTRAFIIKECVLKAILKALVKSDLFVSIVNSNETRISDAARGIDFCGTLETGFINILEIDDTDVILTNYT